MSISFNSSNETIAPSTSKQTEMGHSKSFSRNSVQKKREMNVKRNFFGTKLATKRRSQRLCALKSKRINVEKSSEQQEVSKKREPKQKQNNFKLKVVGKMKVNFWLYF